MAESTACWFRRCTIVEFIAFLESLARPGVELHLIRDNYRTYTHPRSGHGLSTHAPIRTAPNECLVAESRRALIQRVTSRPSAAATRRSCPLEPEIMGWLDHNDNAKPFSLDPFRRLDQTLSHQP